jgi:hypothetical protein
MFLAFVKNFSFREIMNTLLSLSMMKKNNQVAKWYDCLSRTEYNINVPSLQDSL